jgi:hypothetical protein
MFTLDQIVPWGRSFDEYRRMFALGDGDLRAKILGCADGPASFNADATALGGHVISCDPLYRLNATEIRDRIAATSDEVLEQTRLNVHEFVWETIRSVEELRQLRIGAMEAFLKDYDAGKRESRYVDAGVPILPFPDQNFDLAICSHFLFLYTSHLSEAFHKSAVLELCRVAADVRIFPLLALGGKPSAYVPGMVEYLRDCGYDVSIERVPYEFQRGGNQMMRIRRAG